MAAFRLVKVPSLALTWPWRVVESFFRQGMVCSLEPPQTQATKSGNCP